MKRRCVQLSLFLATGMASAGTPINDTGIKLCGDYAFDAGGVHNNDVDCGLAIDEHGDPVPPDQDGRFGRDVTHNDDSDGRAGFSFTKIDSFGSVLANGASNWDCVRDNVTGLMWEVKTDDDGLRDKDWTYTWYNPDSSTNGGSSGTENEGTCLDGANCDTAKFVAEVNATDLCNFQDWRLPDPDELRSIVDYSVPFPGPTIDAGWFQNATSSVFWSASPIAQDPESAWSLDFSNGDSHFDDKSNPRSVRLVRGAE